MGEFFIFIVTRLSPPVNETVLCVDKIKGLRGFMGKILILRGRGNANPAHVTATLFFVY